MYTLEIFAWLYHAVECRMRGMTARRTTALMCVVAGMAASCSPPPAGKTTVRVRIAGGPPNATFAIVANALAGLYTQRVSNVTGAALSTTGTTENLEAVETGTAECALGSADLVYDAHIRGTARIPHPYTRLRGVAVLFPNTVHLVTRADSTLTTLAAL